MDAPCAVAVAVLHDALDRLDGAVAAECAARGVKRDGDFGAFLDAMCDKAFGVVQLVCVARRVIAPEAAGEGLSSRRSCSHPHEVHYIKRSVIYVTHLACYIANKTVTQPPHAGLS